ncbi:MAG: DUF5067 domain-containing protein [Oscillibacter sp.]|nr:DUF5067 domain-containing protein [Oscillibacter sp.]
MKKFAAALLSLALVLSLCACAGGDKAGVQANDSPAEEEAAASAGETSAPAEESAVPVEETAAPQTDAEERTVPPLASSGIVGVYKLTGLTEEGEDGGEELNAMVEAGMRTYLVVQEDGSAYMDLFGQQIGMKWDESAFYSENEEDGEEPLGYAYEDGVLNLLPGESDSMEFTKLTEEELTEYEENGSGSILDLLEGLGLGDLASAIPEGEPSDGPVSGEIEGNTVTVLGAESFEEDGTNYIRFYFDFTNGGGETTSVFMALYEKAVQDGGFLIGVSGLDSAVPEDEGADRDIAPGETIRCTEIYEFDPDGGTVAVMFSDVSDEQTVIYYADPQNLSGAPEG